MEPEERRGEEHHEHTHGKFVQWVKKHWAWLLLGAAAAGLLAWYLLSSGSSSQGAGAVALPASGGGSSTAPTSSGSGTSSTGSGAALLASVKSMLSAQSKSNAAMQGALQAQAASESQGLQALAASQSQGQQALAQAVSGLTSRMGLLSQQDAASQQAYASQLRGLQGLQQSLAAQEQALAAAAQQALSPAGTTTVPAASLDPFARRRSASSPPSSAVNQAEIPVPAGPYTPPYTPPSTFGGLFRPGTLSAITGQVTPAGGGNSYSPWQALYAQLQQQGHSPTLKQAVVNGQSVTQVFNGSTLAGTFSNP